MEILVSKVLSKKVKDIPFQGPVFEVSSNDTVNEAFHALGDKGYLSAPIWNEEKKKYEGFFDVTNALTMIYTVDLMASILPHDWVDKKEALKMLHPDKKAELKIIDLVEQSKDDTSFGISPDWNVVYEDSDFKEALKLLANHVKRVPVVSRTTGRVVKIITASQVTKMLDDALKDVEAKHGEEYLKKVPKCFSLPPSQITNLRQPKKIFTVKATDLVRDAMLSILEHKVSAVAVIDEDDMLLSSISTSDVRLFDSLEQVVSERVLNEDDDDDDDRPPVLNNGEEKPKVLMDYPCEDFVKLVREHYESKRTTKVPYVSVGEDFILRRIISKLAFTRKHRVWITNKDKHVVGVVSVSDIAELLLKEMS